MSDTSRLQNMPRWYWIPVRVVLVTFILTLISFAVTLLITIAFMMLLGRLRGTMLQMSFAYRHVAAPVAMAVAAIIFLTMSVIEIRHYLRRKSVIGRDGQPRYA